MTWGRKGTAVAVLVAVATVASCGMVSNEDAGGAAERGGPSAAAPLRATTTSTTVYTPPEGVGATVPDLEPSAGVPVGGEIEGLSPEDLAVLERCRLINEMNLAGQRVLQVAAAEPEKAVSAVEDVREALEALRPIVSGDVLALLDSIILQMTDAIGEIRGLQGDAIIGALDAATVGMAPAFTQLLGGLRPLCEIALAEDDVDLAEQIQVGSTV